MPRRLSGLFGSDDRRDDGYSSVTSGCRPGKEARRFGVGGAGSRRAARVGGPDAVGGWLPPGEAGARDGCSGPRAAGFAEPSAAADRGRR